jgi:hypothetical protein
MNPEKVVGVEESTSFDGMGFPTWRTIRLSGFTIADTRNKKASIQRLAPLWHNFSKLT